MYKSIYDFCKAKNRGNCYKNGTEPTPRVNFITSLCEKEGIDYELDSWVAKGREIKYDIMSLPDVMSYVPDDKIDDVLDTYNLFNEEGRELLASAGIDAYPEDLGFEELDAMNDEFWDLFDEYTEKAKNIIGTLNQPDNTFFNVVLKGSSDKFVVAHHDIVNPNSDNANDNSCSVINAIAIKKLRPEVNVVLLDGEEVGGIGSGRLAQRIKNGDFRCKWILNLELSGRGGKNFFVGAMGTPLTDWIANRFECPIVNVPFNDSAIFKRYGINSTVINPLPITSENSPVVNKDGEFLDFKMLFNCHKAIDSVETIDPNDMKEFVEEVCLKIIDEA